MEEVYEYQIKELQKLDFNFYLYIAKSREPLTYTFVNNNKEHQTEIFFDGYNDAELDIVIAFDTHFEGRFRARNSTTFVYKLNKANEWVKG